ncbi:class I SAM-dependent methyltransferase [Lysobacter sp. BMK333-48F3]|uniref:class I SAM-dependent methyltransferase n=1 Tax=Lysobacter sp. BMK333-48F3 TaxID=2867962 RepID=UPI001C8CF049|nr:class I SAM-dependent methyltransferase [Lysobacter sp. BMK333-48F3]
MSLPSNDPARRRHEQRRQWDSVAAGWAKWWPTIENGAQGVSRRMLALARIEPGQRVLDIGTGIGEPALMAASRVGPSGRVVATDLSPAMLDIARDRARELGLANVQFVEADAVEAGFADARFDAALCRWGVTSLPDPFQALVAIRRFLVPGGRFVTAVWQSGPEGRPMADLAATVARELFGLPSPAPQAPASHRSANEELQDLFARAGFSEVRSEEMAMALEFSSAEDCGRYLIDVSPEFSALLGDQPLAQRMEFDRRLGECLQPYATADGGVRIPNLTVCATGRG